MIRGPSLYALGSHIHQPARPLQVLSEIKTVLERSGLRNVYIATIHPPMVPKYKVELATLLQNVPGAQSASDLKQMAQHLGVPPHSLTRWTQSLVEQELCASAHEFLGSERSTWTGNVALEREAHGRRRNNFFGSVVGAGGKTLVELRSQVTRGREDLG